MAMSNTVKMLIPSTWYNYVHPRPSLVSGSHNGGLSRITKGLDLISVSMTLSRAFPAQSPVGRGMCQVIRDGMEIAILLMAVLLDPANGKPHRPLHLCHICHPCINAPPPPGDHPTTTHPSGQCSLILTTLTPPTRPTKTLALFSFSAQIEPYAPLLPVCVRVPWFLPPSPLHGFTFQRLPDLE
jgi:hypothetical protein